MAINTGANVSKAVGDTVLKSPGDVNVSKAVGYVVLEAPRIAVTKAGGYAVLSTPTPTARPIIWFDT